MQSTDPTPADFLAARTARGVSIKTSAIDIGLAFSNIVRWNRGEPIGPLTIAKIAAWIDETPVELDEPQEWKPVIGWEGFYEVSDIGNVRSVERRVKHRYSGEVTIRTRVIRQTPDTHGYPQVSLAIDGKQFSRKVHQLVLEAFVGPKPAGMEGCHYDGHPTNNHLSNLRWDTRSGNRSDAKRHGTLWWPGKEPLSV